MKLKSILECGHWDLAPGVYPNSMIKTKKNKPKRHSPLLHPDDRERFISWSKGESNAK